MTENERMDKIIECLKIIQEGLKDVVIILENKPKQILRKKEGIWS